MNHFIEKNILNEDEIEKLDIWLENKEGLISSFETLDGFLTACAISPDSATPKDWLQLILGTDTTSEAEIAKLCIKHHKSTAERIQIENSEDPFFWWPIILDFPDESPETTESGLGQDWATGFHIGSRLSESWDTTIHEIDTKQDRNPEEDSLIFCHAPMMILESGGNPSTPEQIMNLGELREIVPHMIAAVRELNSQFSAHLKEK
ncbi:YecA family protein [Fibrobacterales bacterium]|nr:YecA family protein [Fibrobacterales bacterium]